MLLLILVAVTIALRPIAVTGTPMKLRLATSESFRNIIKQSERKLTMTEPIKDLEHPLMYWPFVAKFTKAINFANTHFFENRIRVSETYRTLARQGELYAKGRTTKGAKVTKARSGESLHSYGCAVDLFFVGHDGKYETQLDDYKKLEGIMVMFGLKHIRWADYGHYEVATSLNLVEIYKASIKKGMTHDQAVKHIHQELNRERVFFKAAESGMIV